MNYIKPIDFQQRPIVVIGAGTLGSRIALTMATREGKVHVFDPSQSQLNKAKMFLNERLPKLMVPRPVNKPAEIIFFNDFHQAIQDAWLILEAIPEKLELKEELFCNLDRLAPADAILATNSSSIPSSKLLNLISQQGKTRVLNLHFYMPPEINVVEIMSSGETDPQILNLMMDLLPEYGLRPFLVQGESMGFIFNRVWAAIKRECLELVAAGVSTPQDVDQIWSIITGTKHGPFCQMDAVGLDVVLDIEENYALIQPTLPEAPRVLLKELIGQGRLGTKSGKGFFEY